MVLNRRKTTTSDGVGDLPDETGHGQHHLTQREKHEKSAEGIKALHVASAEHRPTDTYDDKISIGKIRPENQESNSRTRFVIYDSPLVNPFEVDDARYREAQETINSIKRLAGSIRESGLLNNIEVYTSGSQYHIVHGHKRYFALKCLYGDNHAINCTVHRRKPKDLLIRRFAENSARSDLSLQAELLQFEKTLEGMHEVYPNEKLTIRFVADTLALKKSKVGVYLKVLRKMPELRDQVLDYEIQQFSQLQAASMEKGSRTVTRRQTSKGGVSDTADQEGVNGYPGTDDSPGFLLDIGAEHLVAMVENHFPEIPVESYRNQPVLLANALSSHIKKTFDVTKASDNEEASTSSPH